MEPSFVELSQKTTRQKALQATISTGPLPAVPPNSGFNGCSGRWWRSSLAGSAAEVAGSGAPIAGVRKQRTAPAPPRGLRQVGSWPSIWSSTRRLRAAYLRRDLREPRVAANASGGAHPGAVLRGLGLLAGKAWHCGARFCSRERRREGTFQPWLNSTLPQKQLDTERPPLRSGREIGHRCGDGTDPRAVIVARQHRDRDPHGRRRRRARGHGGFPKALDCPGWGRRLIDGQTGAAPACHAPSDELYRGSAGSPTGAIPRPLHFARSRQSALAAGAPDRQDGTVPASIPAHRWPSSPYMAVGHLWMPSPVGPCVVGVAASAGSAADVRLLALPGSDRQWLSERAKAISHPEDVHACVRSSSAFMIVLGGPAGFAEVHPPFQLRPCRQKAGSAGRQPAATAGS
jgi:hypothetical protein